MIVVFTFLLGLALLIGGLVLLHYLKFIVVGALLLLGGFIYWLFFDTPRHPGGWHHGGD